MKFTSVRFEPYLVAAALLIGTLAVMWIQRPAPGCALAWAPRQQLVLSSELDQERLATEVASAQRIARRYVRPLADPAQQETQLLECEATLVQQIATRNGLSPDQVRASLTNARQRNPR